MDDQIGHFSNEPNKTPSPPSEKTTDRCSSGISTKLVTSPLSLEYNSLNSDVNDPVKYLDFQRMLNEEGNAMMALKISEYEKALAKRDYTITSLHTDIMNSKNKNYVLINQYKNIMDKTNSVSDFCARLNTSFTNICERLNTLGETVDNARTRQKEVIELVDQTKNEFEEKNLNISDKIDDSLKQINEEKIRSKQELEILENKYSLDLIACKTKLEESINQIENLKSENAMLLEKLNDNMKLNEEKRIALNLNQTLEKELKMMEDQNAVLFNQNKSIRAKYDEIQLENQSLKDELIIMKNSLDETTIVLNDNLSKIKDQEKFIDMLKVTEELNYTLKKDNFDLKERNECLEKINTDLMDNISNNKVQEEKENQLKDMCKNYDDLLKMQEEKLMDITRQLGLQTEKENKFHSEILNLKKEIDMYNKTIINLQEEGKANNILIPELQNKIDVLNADLVDSNQKLRDSSKDFLTEKNALEKEKIELEKQSTLHFMQIEQLTARYMKYKSKFKQLYVEVMRLRSIDSRSGQKKIQPPQISETIEAMNDYEGNNIADVSVLEFNDQDASKVDVSVQSTSSRANQNYSYLKRNASPSLPIVDSSIKKHRPSDPAALQKNIEYNYNVKENIVPNNTKSPLTPRKEKFDGNNDVKSQLNSYTDANKKFKTPTDMLKSSQKTSKSTNVPKDVWAKPNSPVTLTAVSPKQNVLNSKGPFGK